MLPRDIGCLRNISINTLHKGDDDDIDNNSNNNDKKKKKKKKKNSYSWRPGMETSGVAGNRVLLRLRKVTATRQLKAATHSQSKPPSPKYSGTCRGKIKKGLEKRGNKRSFRKYVSNIPGKHEIKELQKTAILGTAHILRKVLK